MNYVALSLLILCCFVTGFEVAAHKYSIDNLSLYYLYWFGILSVFWAIIVAVRMEK